MGLQSDLGQPVPSVIVVMGVSGCGKSTVGSALAARLDCPFLEGDDFHPEGNISKMRNGSALTEADRGPWISALVRATNICSASRLVLACSALSQSVRQKLISGTERCVFLLHLTAAESEVYERLKQRRDHFMSVNLLHSQFDAFENPSSTEASGLMQILAYQPLEEIIVQIERTWPHLFPQTRNSNC